MIDVKQALKNNIFTLLITAMACSAVATIVGLCVAVKIYNLAIIFAILSVFLSGIGISTWNQILIQIKILEENKSYVINDNEES
jgi:hypothetical protein